VATGGQQNKVKRSSGCTSKRQSRKSLTIEDLRGDDAKPSGRAVAKRSSGRRRVATGGMFDDSNPRSIGT